MAVAAGVKSLHRAPTDPVRLTIRLESSAHPHFFANRQLAINYARPVGQGQPAEPPAAGGRPTARSRASGATSRSMPMYA